MHHEKLPTMTSSTISGVNVAAKMLTFSSDTDDSLSTTGTLKINNQQEDDAPASLEGVLHMRKGKAAGSSIFWKRNLYVVYNLIDGSISCYKFPLGASNSSSAYASKTSKLHKRRPESHLEEDEDKLVLSLPASLPWTAKDLANDPTCFVVELDTQGNDNKREESTVASDIEEEEGSSIHNNESFSSQAEVNEHIIADSENTDCFEELPDDKIDVDEEPAENGGLTRDIIERARTQGKPLRFYFRCLKGGNEKVLWLNAFSRMGKLSKNQRQKRFLLGTLKSKTAVRLTTSRTRSASSAAFARESKQLETTTEESGPPNVSLNLSFAKARKRDKEHKALPEHAYPNVWMTQEELREEMEKPSSTFHNLRENSLKLPTPNNPCQKPEVGALQIECLQGVGFPKLDRFSQTDAVVYIVSGPYAFCTDVIKNRANPMWLAKTQRACAIPLHHAYARIYIGVFDDDKHGKDDDFNGRIVLDVSRLRPNCTYDVTLPLRLSSHVYSRRKRGALRLRFRLQWGDMRSALCSYLEFSKPKITPNTEVLVPCGSARAFRNVAITVHGAHLPGKFSFQHLRATLREINFTRKSMIFTLRQTVLELREWHNPVMSAFVFCAWMHCIYNNAMSLVPAYLVSFFMLHLIRNYSRYGMDGPAQRGFIPPSWEELLMGLLRNPAGDSPSPIQPLNMGYQTEVVNDNHIIKYNFETHEPKGKALFRTLGFMEEEKESDDDETTDHLEFPFADGKIYPKFGVKDSLVSRKKKPGSPSGSQRYPSPPRESCERRFMEMPKLPNMIRKDLSGLNDYDDEEQRFATTKFIRQTGATSLRDAASGLIDVGESLTEATGLQYVVSPIIKGGRHYVVPPLKSGYHQVVPPILNGINHTVVTPLQHTVDSIRRSSTELWPIQGQDSTHIDGVDSLHDAVDANEADASFENFDADPSGAELLFSEWGREEEHPLNNSTAVAPAEPLPDQDIDFQRQNRKRLTDDLVEVKEKMHELTFHRFNDRAYVVKDPTSQFFGEPNQRALKRRRVDVSRNLDKLLQTGRYSHPNVVVARVGQYVEPIIGASHSFLCAFRAMFNVMTWRDPFLTFWVSLFGAALVVILFLFPWRLFLFILGVWFVGPHQWLIRILRARGTLPPKKPRNPLDTIPEDSTVPDDQVVFKGHISQDHKRKKHKPVQPKDIRYAVVPYSPLMYQRFYDWPPERDFAQVRPDVSFGPDPRGVDAVPATCAANLFFSSTVAATPGKKEQ